VGLAGFKFDPGAGRQVPCEIEPSPNR